MEIVNKVLTFTTTQNEIPFTPKKVYNNTPTMKLYKINNCTMLLFANGKSRIMGKPTSINDFIENNSFLISNLKLVTMTVTYTLPYKVNLHKISKPFSYEFELFNAAYIKLPEHVNIFASGKIVILGVKSELRARNIITIIESLLLPFYIIE